MEGGNNLILSITKCPGQLKRIKRNLSQQPYSGKKFAFTELPNRNQECHPLPYKIWCKSIVDEHFIMLFLSKCQISGKRNNTCIA